MADRMTFRTYYDEDRARHHIAWKFPTSVQAYTGALFTHTFRKGVEPTREMIREQIVRYHARIYEAAPTDTFIEGMEQLGEQTRRERLRREIDDAERGIRLADIADRLKAIQEHIEFRQDAEVMQAKYGVAVPLPVLEQVSFDQALKDLKSHDRHQRGWRNERQEKKFDQAKRRAWEALSAFAKDAGIIDHANMAAIPWRVIQAWSDSLNPNPGAPTTTIPHDYTADVKALYEAVKRRITKDDDPTERINDGYLVRVAGLDGVSARDPNHPKTRFFATCNEIAVRLNIARHGFREGDRVYTSMSVSA